MLGERSAMACELSRRNTYEGAALYVCWDLRFESFSKEIKLFFQKKYFSNQIEYF
jgi:hypothetical protein